MLKTKSDKQGAEEKGRQQVTGGPVKDNYPSGVSLDVYHLTALKWFEIFFS